MISSDLHCFSLMMPLRSRFAFRRRPPGGVISKEVFLTISQNPQENTCARVSYLSNFTKKRLWHECFTVNFAKFLRTPFLQNTSGRLLVAFDLLLLLRSLSWTDVCIGETNELSDELGEKAPTALPLSLHLSFWTDWVKPLLIGVLWGVL